MRPHVLLALLLAGCAGDFDRQSQLNSVRVLAVKTTPAEWAIPTAGFPQDLALEALVFAPEGAEVKLTFAVCKPGNPYAADFECPGKDGVTLSDSRVRLTDLAAAFEGAAPGTGGGPGATEALQRGIPLFIGYEANDGSGRPEGRERGVRRVTLRQTDTPNQNPSLVELNVDGAPLQSIAANATVKIEPVLSAESREVYVGPDGEATEPIVYSWHATGGGTVNYFRTVEPEGDGKDLSATEYTAAGPERIRFLVVARDGRGGTTWIDREVEVR